MIACRLVLFVALIAASAAAAAGVRAGGCGNSTGKIPLSDWLTGDYQGFEGGLYPGPSNVPPQAHLDAALDLAETIVPLAAAGNPDPCGQIALLSIGMSNTNQKFATFERQEDLNPLRHPRLVLVNGAQGGQSAQIIQNPGAAYWDTVALRLDALGLTPEQVQVVWLEEAIQGPANDFPGHAELLRDFLELIVQNLKTTFPNLKLCYVSNRTYGGYNNGNPEPQAYENGFSVRWLIEDQIEGKPELNFDPAQGPVRAPLLLWGPDLWADGEVPRSDGLEWCACDFENCFNAHPSASGEQKVADLLSDFFNNDATTQAWYVNPGLPALVALDAEADAHVEAAAATTNFGSAVELFTQGGPEPAQAFVRFDLSGIPRPVHHAKLSFRNPENHLSSAPRDVRLVSDTTWDESTITFDLKPPIDGIRPLTIPLASRDGTRSHVVTGEVNTDGDGVLTFALLHGGTIQGAQTPSLVHSREGGHPPRLILAQAPGCVVCGDAVCDPVAGETCASCPVDCATGPEVTCDGLDNDCNEATPDGIDADEDGVTCHVDCNDNDPQVFAVPSEVLGVTMQFNAPSGTARLTWPAPAEPGAPPVTLTYDTLRSTDPADFLRAGTLCVESDDGPNTLADDLTPPAPGQAFYYLVRAANACGAGTLGTSSGGTQRAGLDCP